MTDARTDTSKTEAKPPDGALLACQDLRKAYGDLTAVDGVSFSIAPGEAYGLLGPNGAGKTTTISMLCGLLAPDTGEVTVAGRSMRTDARRAKAAIGYVPQELALYPELTAAENLAFFGRLYCLRGAPLRTRVDEVLEIVGLSDRGNDRIDSYSGGMKRRVNIAAGLIHEPRLVVLDEPTVGVDPQSRNAILESVAALSGQGTAVLYTSHYMEEVERLCDRVGIIDSGRMVAEGTRRALVARVGQRDRIELTVEGDAEAVAVACAKLSGIHESVARGHTVELLASEGRALLAEVIVTASAAGAAVTGVEVTEPNLEAVFLHLTGKALRD
jgi:ABC-2 type transport system ATP-binding protein